MDQSAIDLPKGFRAAACSAGIKKSGKLDLALICSETPARCAGVFTTNKVVAAPLLVTQPRIRQGFCQAILVNSGNANACTGESGEQAARQCTALVAQELKIDENLVAVSSTGVIGVPLLTGAFQQHIPGLVANLDHHQIESVAKAMMTTDAFSKMSSRCMELGGKTCSLLGIAKGAGMIHPNMATMLAFVLTDAMVSRDLLNSSLRKAVDRSFNRITVDRDTSTNDMVLLLASGAAGNAELGNDPDSDHLFQACLDEVLLDLAKMIVRDGEGATKLVRILIVNAQTDADALMVARSVATSTLVKTAFFGEDANWGRIIAAAGYAGAEFDPRRVKIYFEDVLMVENGVGLDAEQEKRATEVLKRPEFTVTIDLGLGQGTAYYYTSDLGYEYVRINADYRT